MSSMRNAVQRRNHRERAQPLERRRLGLLEKHKDYSLRAADYNKKKKHLKNLAQKAADRNPDEFYFGMMSRQGPGQRVKEGKGYTGFVKGDRGNKAMSVDMVRLLKTQDVGYVRTMRQVAAKEVRRLEEQVVLTRGLDRLDDDDEDEEMEDEDDEDFMFDLPTKPKPARKIVFMDDEDERNEVLDQIEDDDDNDADEFDGFDDKPQTEEEAQNAEDLRRLRKKLDTAKKKLQVLADAEQDLEEQRAKMAKTATSGGETASGKKIRVRTRKR